MKIFNVTFSLILTMTIFFPIHGQNLSFGLSTKNYWINEAKYLRNDAYVYEKYSNIIPYQLTLKAQLSKYGHVFCGYNNRVEKLRRFSVNEMRQPFILNGVPGLIVIKKDGLMWDSRLYLSEFTTGIGKEFKINRFIMEIETGTIYTKSNRGRNEVYFIETPGVSKFEEKSGKYLDAIVISSLGCQLTKKMRVSLSAEYRRTFWQKRYYTLDYKFIYKFPSNERAPMFGLGVGLEYGLFD